ncbi:MAG TPA: glycoside hydrolase [Thermoanaerobaculia bacterium]
MKRTLVLLSACLTLSAHAMEWRGIGPFRGGRTVAAVGVPQQPNVFYIGVNNGGVWKTTDYGRIWMPIFDDQPTGSVGAIAVAPSDPNVIYVGSGEGLQRPDLSTGDGIYKSTDAGKTWAHLGLRDGQQIPMISVDPHDANRLFVAVLGHPYGPNEERGIFRSTDGGKTFEKVLYKNENVGGVDVLFDPSNAQTVYAVLWEQRQGPWENGSFRGNGSGFFKSTDGGSTWKQITNGLPGSDDGLSRIGLGNSPADPKRLYAVVNATKKAGVYRSDDEGESWHLMNDDGRLVGYGGDMNEIRTDPKNADVVYIAAVASWKSTDGGKTWGMFRGAPGGDDYHRFWINPDNPNIILLAADQGAVITVNGGESWSSWYNQPTAQFYHVSTDNAFPYRVCGGQQESGSACVASRGDDGEITFREWHPVGAEEYGYVVADPLNPDIVFGGKVSRYDRRTDQVNEVGPMPLRGKSYRTLRTMPIVFSPTDPHVLYFASNTVWKTLNGGQSWSEISPDLTRSTWSVPANVGIYANSPGAKPTQRGVIYALAPSPLDGNRIWAGTDDGLIQATIDGGKNWTNVTPKELVPFAKVSILEASHFHASEAYAAINTLRLDDLRPHIYRTKDGGKSWVHVTNGIPDGANVNVVREDPKKEGLLFAGSETQVYVSFDDGDHWESLRLNMPASSVRDLVIHEDDLVAGTHGRGAWILDDIEPLRQHGGTTRLLKPARAWRFRWNKNTDTPLPPDEPAAPNPPDGAIIDYYLASPASAVTLVILDANGKLVRKYSSSDPSQPPTETDSVPAYWIRPPQTLGTTAGLHRYVWDLHYTPAPGVESTYPIAAIAHNTAPAPTSPWVMPGTYSVKLTVTVDGNAKSFTEPLTVRIDPRVKTPREGLEQQSRISKQMYDGVVRANAALEELHALRKTLSKELGAKAAEIEGESRGGFEYSFPRPIGAPRETLSSVSHSMLSIMNLAQQADVTPSQQLEAAAADRQKALEEVLGRFGELKKQIH